MDQKHRELSVWLMSEFPGLPERLRQSNHDVTQQQ